MFKLHLACGSNYKQNWINVDIRSNIKTDVCQNVVLGKFWATINDNSVDYVFSEHFVEHIYTEEFKFILKQCNEKLKPGGILRIATPDMDWLIKRYYDGDWQSDDWLHMADIPEGKLITTAAEYINIGMRAWDHKFVYDYETLRKYAFEAGFSLINREKFGKSKYNELQNLETRIDSRLIVELMK